MSFKAILLCASALLVQSISGCCNRIAVPTCGCASGNLLSSGNSLSTGNLLSSGLSCSGVSNNGGAFNVQSVGPIVPMGIATATDLNLAANLALSGMLPWLSAVEFGGQLSTAGTGSVSYGCGDGNIGITSVNGGNAGISAGYGLNSVGLNSIGLNNCGCGCGYVI